LSHYNIDWITPDDSDWSAKVSNIDPADTSATIDDDIEQGVTYQFDIQACNDRGCSAFVSAISILAAQEPGQPDAPGDWTLWTDGSTVGYWWTIPDNGGSPITSYRIAYREYNVAASYADWNPNWTDPLTADDLEDTITGLTQGTEYEVIVYASNVYGESVASDSVVIKAAQEPGPPG